MDLKENDTKTESNLQISCLNILQAKIKRSSLTPRDYIFKNFQKLFVTALEELQRLNSASTFNLSLYSLKRPFFLEYVIFLKFCE